MAKDARQLVSGFSVFWPSLLTLFLGVSVLSCFSMHEANGKSDPSPPEPMIDMLNVLALTTRDYYQKTASGNWFLLFYAPWCGHCKRLKPIFANLSAPVRKSEVSGEWFEYGMVDCTAESKICDSYGIHGYPGLRYLYHGQWYEYKGSRELPAMRDFVARLFDDNVIAVNSAADFEQFVRNKAEVSFLLTIGTEENGEAQADDTFPINPPQFFEDVRRAAAGYAAVKFGLIKNAQLIKDLELPPRSLLAYHDIGSEIYDGKWETKRVNKWVETNRFLVVEELDQYKFWYLSNKYKAMAIMLVDQTALDAVGSEFPSDYTLAHLRALAKSDAKLVNEFVFARLDGTKWIKWLEQFKISTNQLPFLFVFEPDYELFYKNVSMNRLLNNAMAGNNTELAVQLMTTFLYDVLSGKQPPGVVGKIGHIYRVQKSFIRLPMWKQLLITASGAIFVFGLCFLCCCGGGQKKKRGNTGKQE